MAELIIKGGPIAVFEFDYIPSWNEAIDAARGRGWKRGRGHTKKWRRIGEKLAQDWQSWAMLEVPRQFLVNRALVIVKSFRPTDNLFDVHNVYTKAVFDGFSDANIWRDDNYRHVPWVLYGFMPQDEIEMAIMGKAFTIEIYTLDRVLLDGVDRTPPEWRVDYGKGRPKLPKRPGR
jgi:hypothetical protein